MSPAATYVICDKKKLLMKENYQKYLFLERIASLYREDCARIYLTLMCHNLHTLLVSSCIIIIIYIISQCREKHVFAPLDKINLTFSQIFFYIFFLKERNYSVATQQKSYKGFKKSPTLFFYRFFSLQKITFRVLYPTAFWR